MQPHFFLSLSPRQDLEGLLKPDNQLKNSSLSFDGIPEQMRLVRYLVRYLITVYVPGPQKCLPVSWPIDVYTNDLTDHTVTSTPSSAHR